MGDAECRVFVYGTLKPGESNYHLCANSVIEAHPAIAQGQLYALPLGYPVLTPGDGLVYGVALSFSNSDILSILDEYEQHDPVELEQYFPEVVLDEHQYERSQIPIYTVDRQPSGTAWAYLMTRSQAQRLSGVLLPDGHWSQIIHTQTFGSILHQHTNAQET